MCRKIAYPNPDHADNALGRIWTVGRGGHLPHRYYHCPDCGLWHLTSKNLRKTQT